MNKQKSKQSVPELAIAEEFWALAQVLAWIVDRSMQRVAALSPERSSAIAQGQQSETGAFDFLNAIARSGDQQLEQRGASAREELREKLTAGTLTAIGIPFGETEHKQIASASWLTISSLDGPNPKIPADAVWAITEPGPRFVKVRCAACDVRHLWPAPPKGKEPIPSDAEVEKVIRAAIADKGANLTVVEAENFCADKCAGVTRDKIRALLKTVQGPAELGRPRKRK